MMTMTAMGSLLATAWMSTSIAERFGWVWLHSIWQFAVLGLIAAAMQRVMRRRSSSVRYTALTAMLLVMTVAVPLATWSALTDEIRLGSSLDGAALDASVFVAPSELMRSDSAVIPPEVDSAILAPASISATEVDPKFAEPAAWDWRRATARWRSRIEDGLRPWLTSIVIAWAIGVLLFAMRPALGWRAARLWRRTGVGAAPIEIKRSLERMAERLRVRREVSLLQSTLAPVPMVVGCLRPVILLPASVISGLSTAQLEAILAHELAHIRRHDYVVNLLQTLLETVFFYHPAVWGLSRRIREERENCCDDLAADAVGSRVNYGRALLALEEGRGPAPATGLAIGARGGSLLERVRRLLDCDAPPPRAGIGASIAMAALIATAALGMGFNAWAQSQPIENAGFAETVKSDPKTAEPPAQEKKPTENPNPSPKPKPWTVRGRVIDSKGKGVEGADAVVSCGMGSLMPTARTRTDAEGRYELNFGPGVMFEKSSPQTQYATVYVHKAGYYEKNLRRHAGCIASLRPVPEGDLKSWGVTSAQVILPEAPLTLDFTMLPAARVSGTLVDEENRPIPEHSVALAGKDLPPSASVLASATTDRNGRFELNEIPTAFAYQFSVRRQKDLKPPWDDSWASPPLVFANPEERDLVAVDQATGERIVVKSFAIKLIGGGMHDKAALKGAAAAKLDWQGQTRLETPKDQPKRRIADELSLVLRNAPLAEKQGRQDGRTLSIPESAAKRLLARGVTVDFARDDPKSDSRTTWNGENVLRIEGGVFIKVRTRKEELHFHARAALFALPEEGAAEPQALSIQFKDDSSQPKKRVQFGVANVLSATADEARLTLQPDGALELDAVTPAIQSGQLQVIAQRLRLQLPGRVLLSGDVKIVESSFSTVRLVAVSGDMELNLGELKFDSLSEYAVSRLRLSKIVRDLDVGLAGSRQYSDITDVWMSNPDGKGSNGFKIRPDVFHMPLDSEAHLYYVPRASRFYVSIPEPAGGIGASRVYGPFQGDPFLRWELAQELVDHLRLGKDAVAVFGRVDLMLTTGDQRMIDRAFYLMIEALGEETVLQRREEYAPRVEGILLRRASLLKDQRREGEVKRVEGLIRQTRAESEFHAIDILDADYRRPTDADRVAVATVPPSAWGEATDGLRAALVLSADSPNPNKDGVWEGRVAVENVGDRDRRFTGPATEELWNLELTPTAREGQPLMPRAMTRSRSLIVSQSAQPDRIWLKPGERVLLKPTLRLKMVQAGGYDAFAAGALGPRLWLRDSSGVPRRVSPAKSEWSGALRTGRVAIRSASDR